MRKGNIYINNVFCGVLTEIDNGSFVFEYDESYRKNPTSTPVCIAMPLNKARYESSSLFPFFFNLLSEGENRAFKSRVNGIPMDDDFGLLLQTASYDTIGAVTVSPVER